MHKLNWKKIIFNPCLGYISYSLFLFLCLLDIPMYTNYGISIGLTVLFIVVSQFVFKRNVLLFSQVIVLISILVSFVFYVFFNHYYVLSNYVYVVLGGVTMIFQLIFIRFAKTLTAKYLRKISRGADRILINDYILTGSILRNVMTMYLLVLFCYKQMTLSRPNDTLDDFFYYIVPLLIFLAMYLYQASRNVHIYKKFNKEEWLPIMDEHAKISGKIEKNIALNATNKYWHPVIRIQIVRGDTIYLQDRSALDTICPSKLDTPLEAYVTCDSGADKTILELIKSLKMDDLSKVKYLFNYVYENEFTKRINYLYILKIEDKSALLDSGFKGKFWSIKRIDEHFNETFLSELFILEYEYLKNMVLDCTNAYLRKQE